MIFSQYKLTKETLEFLRERDEEDGFPWNPPRCKVCDKELKIGDGLDGMYPYYDDNNCCQEHLEGEVLTLKELYVRFYNQFDDISAKLTKARIEQAIKKEKSTRTKKG